MAPDDTFNSHFGKKKDVDHSLFYCFPGNDALGHPKVYINLDKPEDGVCGYCGKRFISKKHSNNN